MGEGKTESEKFYGCLNQVGRIILIFIIGGVMLFFLIVVLGMCGCTSTSIEGTVAPEPVGDVPAESAPPVGTPPAATAEIPTPCDVPCGDDCCTDREFCNDGICECIMGLDPCGDGCCSEYEPHCVDGACTAPCPCMVGTFEVATPLHTSCVTASRFNVSCEGARPVVTFDDSITMGWILGEFPHLTVVGDDGCVTYHLEGTFMGCDTVVLDWTASNEPACGCDEGGVYGVTAVRI